MQTSVLLAEDHSLVAEGLRRILEGAFDVVEVVGDGESLVQEALRLKPDVLLVDLSLPVLDGFEAARRITARWPQARIIFLTMHSDATYLRRAVAANVLGYVLKSSASNELLLAVREVLSGRRYIDPSLTPLVAELERDSVARVPGLTSRQTEVLRLIATGKSNEEIAEAIGIVPRTVKFHRSQIERKLGLSGSPALTRYAINIGLVSNE